MIRASFFGIGLTACLLATAPTQAQHQCHADVISANHAHDEHVDHGFDLNEFFEKLEEDGRAFAAQGNSGRDIRTVPVVVHIVYNTPNENVSDVQVYGMINQINDDFRRQNSDANQTRPQFVADAADTEIEFCLATIDPNGNATTGITRTSTNKTQWDSDTETDDMKFASSGGKAAWDPFHYLNVWVVDLAPGQNGNVLGYAYLPFGSVIGSSIDGFVIDFQSVGYGERVATHEIGHYFGLRHPWGFQGGGCSDDDGLNDTPTSSGPNFFCDLSATSCGTLDQIENYMDYSSCSNMFSDDQNNLMNGVLSNGRSDLLNSTGCGVPTYNEPGSNFGTTDGDFIDGVELGDIVNLSTGAANGPSYTDFTANFNTEIAEEGTYTISITSGDWTPGNPDYYGVWIDYNQDLDFDDVDEKLGEFQSSGTFTTEDITFTVPLSALWGPTRMRVRGVWSGIPNIDPEFAYDYGETEDYTVTIIQPVAPIAAISVSADTIVVGQTVDFFDESINFPTTWSWDIIGPDTSFTTEDVLGVQVNEAGCVDVYLQVVNGGGSDALFVDCAVYAKDTNDKGWPTGLTQLDPQEAWNIYPVPAREEVFIESRNGKANSGHFVLLNTLGQQVSTGALTGSRTTVGLSTLPEGHYILRVVTELGTAHYRVQRN